jgi:hypothetical protein
MEVEDWRKSVEKKLEIA